MSRHRIIVLTARPDRQFDRYVLPHLRAAGALVTVVDPWLLPTRGLAIEPGPGGLQARYGRRHLTANPARTTVLFGKPRSPAGIPVPHGQPAAHVREQLRLAWRDLLVALEDMKWVSHFTDIRRSESKPLQLQTAAGLVGAVRVPEWTMSSHRVLAPRFIRRQWARYGACIAKPIERNGAGIEGPAYVNQATILSPENTDPDAVPSLVPKILQRYVVGREITAQVMGDDVFGGEYVAKNGGPLPSGIVDVHEAAASGKIKIIGHELPPAVAQFCRQLMRELHLRSGRIDFKLDPQGRYWFLEINPVGMWWWLERYTHQPIGRSLAGMLLSDNLLRVLN